MNRDPRERVREVVEELRDDLVALAADLVAMPTENPPGTDGSTR
jgi:hypothetical protein